MPPSHRDVIVNAMVFVHQSMHKANDREIARGVQTVAVTPRSYLDFINHYVSLTLSEFFYLNKRFTLVEFVSFESLSILEIIYLRMYIIEFILFSDETFQ